MGSNPLTSRCLTPRHLQKRGDAMDHEADYASPNSWGNVRDMHLGKYYCNQETLHRALTEQEAQFWNSRAPGRTRAPGIAVGQQIEHASTANTVPVDVSN